MSPCKPLEYSGWCATHITQGVVNLRSNSALGSVNAGTIAGLGTVIQLQNNITVAENLVIRDVGVGFNFESLGAIRSVGGTNQLTGVIAMTNHGSFGVDSGSYLKVSGQIMVEPGVSDGGAHDSKPADDGCQHRAAQENGVKDGEPLPDSIELLRRCAKAPAA